jgi:hypothetical protein
MVDGSSTSIREAIEKGRTAQSIESGSIRIKSTWVGLLRRSLWRFRSLELAGAGPHETVAVDEAR